MAEGERFVLDHDIIDGDEVGSEQGGAISHREKMDELRNAPSMASSLFKKFDVCPYCSGKYVG